MQLTRLENKGRPRRYRSMVEAASNNIRLSKRAAALLRCYCDQKDGFYPSTGFIEEKTGIRKNKVSEIRRELINHGVLAYVPEKSTTIRWDAIRAFSMINLTSGKRLTKSESLKPENYPLEYSTEKVKTIRALMAEAKNTQMKYLRSDVEDDEDNASIEIDPRTLWIPERARAWIEESEDILRASEDDLRMGKWLEELTEAEYIVLVKSFVEYNPERQREMLELGENDEQIKIEWFDPFRCEEVSACENDGWSIDEVKGAKAGYITTRGETIGISEEMETACAGTGVSFALRDGAVVDQKDIQTYLTALVSEDILVGRNCAL